MRPGDAGGVVAAGDIAVDRLCGGAVAVVRLDRPAARNALSSALVERLGTVLAALDADDAVRAVVLTGSPPGFCAGSDLRELAGLSGGRHVRRGAAAGTGPALVRHEARTGEVVRAIQDLGVPVIAAVEGFAIGGGFLLATGCDLVVSAVDARWHLPEVRLGWVPPWGLQGLIARVGPVTARRLAWGDVPMTGQRMHALGVVDEVAEPGQVLHRAEEVAARLAELPAYAVASTKRALSDAVAGSARTLDERTTVMFGEDARSPTALASIAAFARAGDRR